MDLIERWAVIVGVSPLTIWLIATVLTICIGLIVFFIGDGNRRNNGRGTDHHGNWRD